LNWQNPNVLFTFPVDGEYIGITYDPNNNSLWLGDYITGVISDYTLTGTFLSSFTTSLIPVALAFDPADGTLWFSQDESSTLYQYTTSGSFLQSGTPSGLPVSIGEGPNRRQPDSFNRYVAGDFAEPVSSVPEPTTLALLGTGLLGLAMMRRRKLGRTTSPLT
jgi:DNA-binding beta-propeller fold protein YncE